MIPILYAANENTFTTYGIGALSDAVSCVVTEERNGQYELLMQYPITGKLYDELAAERIIKAKAHPIGDDQLFRIYRMSKPIRGIVTVYAQHISYDLSGIPVAPFTSSYTVTGAMAYLFTGTSFIGSSSISGSKAVSCTEPKSIRAMLGGTQGSLLDLWGGEYRWDNFTVYLNANRGSDKGVVIEYGKDLTALVADHDLTEVYSELLPYATYTDSAGTMHTVVGNAQAITSVITRQKSLIKDFTAILGLSAGTAPTVNQIDTAAQNWLSNNPLGYETPSLTVSFVEGEHGADYPASAARIDLCDTVTIRYTALGVDVKAKVVKSQYDTLLERYTQLTIGKPRANMATTVATLSDEVTEVQTYPSRWSDAIALATKLITGNTGGYVVLHEGSDGTPYELLIMDDPDINAAQNVWRWNVNGLGFSSSGYNGTYATAITANGTIVADFIQTGEIQDALGNNSWNLNTGYLKLKDGELNITYRKAYNHEDYDATDVSTVQNYINGVITSLTDAQWEKYDFIGDRDITNWNKTRIEQMIALQEDTVKTVVTLVSSSVDPNDGINSSVYVPALGTSSGKGVTGTMSGAGLYSSYISAKKIKALRQLLVDSGGAESISIDDTNITLKNATYTKTITASGPTVEGGNSSSDTSVPNNTITELASFDIEPGTYIITATARFASNATGARRFCIRTGSTAGISTNLVRELQAYVAAASGATTCVNLCGIQTFTQANTLHLYVQQHSGGALGTSWAWHYVRLA